MALTLIETKTASSQSSLEFLTGITSPLNNYMLLFHSLVDPSATSNMIAYMQLSTNGGASYITTGYRLNGTSTPGLSIGVFPTSNYILSGSLLLYNLTSGSGYITSVNNSVLFWPTNFSYNNAISCGYETSSIAINALRIVMANGSNFSGEFSLYSIDS
jgi:hypothetical protein